jgi:3'-phosphoadenosine 5'-phosphosulfate sulfotransferase
MSKYPKNPFITGAFHKSNKEFAKLRKLKKREYTQNILDKLDNLQTNNPKEYDLVSNIDCNTWSDYFSNLSKTPAVHMERIDEINKKINDMKNDPNLNISALLSAFH